MVIWQTIVLVIAAFGFPALLVLYLMGGPHYRNDRR